MRGRTALVTGAAGGLGSVMAARLAADGASVLLLDLPASDGRSVAADIDARTEQGGARFVACDLDDLDRTRRLVGELATEHDGIDVLVNAAAIFPSRPFADYSTEEWQRVQRINVDAAFVCAQAVAPMMRAHGFGRIINIASITFYGGWARLAPYVTSKGALVGLTRALARELGPDGVTVNTVAPGAFPTAAERIHPDLEAYNAFILDGQAVKRRGRPEDVANVVSFFASEQSSFVTGQLLCVDGGWVMP